ncbi:MAG: ABC-type transport auxiliary lipoprotein family protein [bacterium]
MRQFIIIFLAALLPGCFGGPKIGKLHILLYYEPAAMEEAGKTSLNKEFPFNLEIKKLKLQSLYDNAKVIIRNSDHSVKFASKGAWAIRPNISATDILLETLKMNMKCKSIKKNFIDGTPDYFIDGEIVTIEEDYRKGSRNASISIILRVSQARSSKILFENIFKKTIPCRIPGYDALAQCFSFGIGEIYNEFAVKVIDILNQELKLHNEKSKGQGL